MEATEGRGGLEKKMGVPGTAMSSFSFRIIGPEKASIFNVRV